MTAITCWHVTANRSKIQHTRHHSILKCPTQSHIHQENTKGCAVDSTSKPCVSDIIPFKGFLWNYFHWGSWRKELEVAIYYWGALLKALQATNRCWEKVKYPLPGMSLLIGYPIQSDQPWNHMHTTKMNPSGLLYVYMCVCIHMYTRNNNSQRKRDCQLELEGNRLSEGS